MTKTIILACAQGPDLNLFTPVAAISGQYPARSHRNKYVLASSCRNTMLLMKKCERKQSRGRNDLGLFFQKFCDQNLAGQLKKVLAYCIWYYFNSNLGRQLLSGPSLELKYINYLDDLQIMKKVESNHSILSGFAS